MAAFITAIVSGGSMYPLLHNGDQLLVVKDDTYAVGDVVMCRAAEGFVRTHRIVRIKKNNIWTKGDNVPHCDEVIQVEQIVGKVRLVIKAKTNQLIDLSRLKNQWRVVLYARFELWLIRLSNFFSKRETKHDVKQRLQSIYYKYVVNEFNYEK